MSDHPKKPTLKVVSSAGDTDVSSHTPPTELKEITELLNTIIKLHKEGRLSTLLMIAILNDGELATGMAGNDSVFRTIGALEIGAQFLKDELTDQVIYE